MINSRALLLYSFTEYLTTANMPKDIDLQQALNDDQVFDPFMNKLNQYAAIQASVDKVTYKRFSKDLIKKELQDLAKHMAR